jgi:glycosyltransferase involved in cell wall biosynthesis
MSDSSSQAPSRISVLTPTYQRAHALPRLYESLVAQTIRNFEWIVVDDGSSDGTRELVDSLRERADFPIVYVWQENQGRHAALNRAVELARGEYCSTIDSDDWYMPEALERMLARWEEIPPERRDEFADVEGLRIDPAGDPVCDRFPSEVFDTDSFEMLALHGVMGDKVGMFRTEVLRRFPAPEDLGWYVTPALAGNRIAAHYATRGVNEVWAYSDYGPGGLTDRKTELRLRFIESQIVYWSEYVAMPRRMRPRARLRGYANCVRYSLLAARGLRRPLRELPSAAWTLLALLPGLLLFLRDRRWLARNRAMVEGWTS